MGSPKSDMKNWGTPRVTTNGGCGSPRCTGKGSRLEDQVAIENWPTPDCSDRRSANSKQQGLSNMVKDNNWPTARTSDAEGGRINTEQTEKGFRSERAKSKQWFGAKLRDATEMDKPKSSKLNPEWVEQLQGLSIGTTQLSGVTDLNENRIDRLRMLGNGVVPQTAAKAFETLLGGY